MQALIAVLTVIFALIVPIYLVCLFRLQAVVRAEHPEWLAYKGEPSIFYSGMPRAMDPNVGTRVLAVAFSSKASLLTSPSASKYVRIIQVTLPVGITVFAGILLCMFFQSAA